MQLNKDQQSYLTTDRHYDYRIDANWLEVKVIIYIQKIKIFILNKSRENQVPFKLGLMLPERV